MGFINRMFNFVFGKGSFLPGTGKVLKNIPSQYDKAQESAAAQDRHSARVAEINRLNAGKLVKERPEIKIVETFDANLIENGLNDNVTFVFGGNLVGKNRDYEQAGFGGQAAVLRPLQVKYKGTEKENLLIEIPTLRKPGTQESDPVRFMDTTILNAEGKYISGPDPDAVKAFREAIELLRAAKPRMIVLPLDGFGTGIAKLDETAPATFNALNKILAEELLCQMVKVDGKWQMQKLGILEQAIPQQALMTRNNTPVQLTMPAARDIGAGLVKPTERLTEKQLALN